SNTTPATAATPTPAHDLSPPLPAEISAALARTYQHNVDFDERGARAVAGDFNGDGSLDLAVVVRPSKGKTGELNGEYANWIVEDPMKVAVPDPRSFDPHQGVQKLSPDTGLTRVEANDTLLVIIHGHMEAGWRNPDARQTFLLRNAVGDEMKSGKRSDVASEARKGMPRLRGDVIREKLGGEAGFLYWTGAKYGWFH
ncbi:MAG: hypothetical protein WCD76_04400, partial [Pyrinomonadaceae bacterium]